MNDDLSMRTTDGQAREDVLLHVLDRLRDAQPSVPLPVDSTKIGPFLRDLRKRLGVKQADLVTAGVGTQGTISALENGHKMPLFPTVIAYLGALGCVLGVVRADGEPIPDQPPVKPRAPRKPDTRDRRGRVRPSRARSRTLTRTMDYGVTSTGRCLQCFHVHDGDRGCR